MTEKSHASSPACPVSNRSHPPSPVIHDGSHTALEQRFEEEVAREEELRFVSPRREEKVDRRS